jgi:hypothetical protein
MTNIDTRGQFYITFTLIAGPWQTFFYLLNICGLGQVLHEKASQEQKL